MLILTGKNLGERHHEFNQKLAAAADNKTSFNEIKLEEEQSELDTLFKIGLATRFKNFEYIIEILKSGHSLYVTRALKCSWIYDDGYMDIVNPTYLHQNIFQHMSQRMIKKMLTIISLHVRNEHRVISFYKYCMNSKLKTLAFKFLIYTPELFKMALVTNDGQFNYFDNDKYLKDFIGNSLPLAVAYVEMHSVEARISVLHSLRFLYFTYTGEYLDMLEKYDRNDVKYPNSTQRLGIKISKDILKKHKNRIWKYAVLYTNKLNKSMLVKFLTTEDVKNLAPLLLPGTTDDFWSIDFYNSYKFILNLIPTTDIFDYLKRIFTLKYSNDLFEMNYKFYSLYYYEMLTVEEQEPWALRHIERDEEVLGSGNDYIWYRFVSFDKAFQEIKKYVYITVNNNKRSDIVNNLVYSAKSQDDLTKLIDYYYERHVNESFEHKTSFIDQIISVHNVYTFTDVCWTSFNKLLCSLEKYGKPDTYSINWKLKKYTMMATIYHVLNKKEFPRDLEACFKGDRCFDLYYDNINALSEEQRNFFIKYWLDMRTEEVRILLEKPCDEKIQEDIRDEVYLIWCIIWCYNRDEKECPEMVMNYMKSNLDFYTNHSAIRPKFQIMTEGDFVRSLKNDIQLSINYIVRVKSNAHRWLFKLNRFFRKIKVYFSNDVSRAYLEYFIDSLEVLRNVAVGERIYRNVKMAVAGVFQLGSKELQLFLLEKYAPVNKKIDHSKIDSYLLQVQKAICRLIYYSNPSFQLSSIRKYVTGDYLQYCLPLFNNYLVNLPLIRAKEFIYEIIDSPVSVQKHGLRLAFRCFNADDLAPIIHNGWTKTKNVSLRLLLYKTLFMRLMNEDGDSQKAMYDVLKMYTMELNDRDDSNVFDHLVSDDMPEHYRGDFIETTWRTVSKFSNKNLNLIRKTSIIYHMKENIYLIQREFLREHIIDEHVRTLVHKNTLKSNCGSHKIDDLMKAKWHLTATFIVSSNTTLEIIRENWKLARSILTKCMEMWSYQNRNVFTYRKFCTQFLNTIHEESCSDTGRYTNVIPIYRHILNLLQNSLPKEELYLVQWNWKLYIESRRVIYLHHVAHNECTNFTYPCAFEVADAFAKNVGKIVEKLVVNEEFYYSFYPDMANALNSVCHTMGEMTGFSTEGLKILISGHLTQFNIYETQALAVMVIPEIPPEHWEKRHENAIRMIKEYDDDEIKGYIFKKFPHFGCGVNEIP